MNKYRKLSLLIIVLELLCILLVNVFFIKNKVADDSHYKVEIERAIREIKDNDLSKIQLSNYKSIIGVKEFNPKDVINNDYYVKEVNGKLYCIEYEKEVTNKDVLILNIGFFILLTLSLVIIVYIYNSIIKPYNEMSDLTYELAKGNLGIPIKANNNSYFGKFQWGLDMLRETLKSEKEKALELHRERKTLILSLSHDIKTPLSTIELSTKALQSGLYENEDKKKDVINGISNNAKEINNYLEHIIEASRNDFLELEVKNDEFYLVDLITKIKDYYSERLIHLHIKFNIDEINNCILFGDFDKTFEVIQNIMENAIKYGNGKYIHIYFNKEEDFELISVENSSSDNLEAELTNIFDSFYRGSNSKNINGSGLGLFIAKNLMRKMHGDIFAKTDDSKFIMTVVIKRV